MKSNGTLGEIAALFAKLGVIGFGGPAAHIAMMEEEVVAKRGWMSQAQFLDLVGVTSIIPGPNSTEMAIHIGYLRGGIPGLLVAGICFILPAVAITTGFAWLYMSYGAIPQVAWMLYGVKPAVLAVIAGALWRLGWKAVKGWRLAFLGTAVALVSLTEFSGVIALIGGGLMGMLWLRTSQRGGESDTMAFLLPFAGTLSGLAVSMTPGAAPSMLAIGLFFLKIGSILYGSGYVLVSFLEEELVLKYAWMTHEQLLDAIAIGQLTPGPVLSTAAFIGYVVTGGNLSAAAVAAGAIFLPSFVFVVALNPLIPKLRSSAWVSAFLDAVNVCAVGLLAGVTFELGALTLDEWPKWVIVGVAGVFGLWRGVGALWLVLGGAVAGWLVVSLGY
ncbi:MAG: chromate efflux transporter [bacterium]|nr:chromate efflux transporter [bacterium]